MRTRTTPILVALLICLAATTATAQITPYSQDFEGLVQTDTAALGNDGWLVFGNVFAPDGTTYLYGYGPFPAPNDGFGFCQIDVGQGGVDQGAQQLVVYSDYNNQDHGAGNWIESNTYREWTIDASNVGQTWNFSFQAKKGNIELDSTAWAFIKTLDPNNGYATTNFIQQDMTAIPTTWGGWTLSLTIDASLVGQLFQIGFACSATQFRGSGIYYDNVVFEIDPGTAAPPVARGVELAQNLPNPFNPNTYIGFTLEQGGSVQIDVYDMKGRHVANLVDQSYPAGVHGVTWDGKSDAGVPVASGQYRYVLRTATGQVSKAMTLLK